MLTHGVGPMRTYSIGALLLDLDDPTVVIGQTAEPLHRTRGPTSRTATCPNVVYSCGALRHGDHLVVPFGIADSRIGFATFSIADVLAVAARRCRRHAIDRPRRTPTMPETTVQRPVGRARTATLLALPADVRRSTPSPASGPRGLLAVRPVRCHPPAVEAASVMMLRFQWDSLRRGDHVLVHDVERRRPRAAARPSSSSSTPRRGGHDVAVRYSDGVDAGRRRAARAVRHPPRPASTTRPTAGAARAVAARLSPVLRVLLPLSGGKVSDAQLAPNDVGGGQGVELAGVEAECR